MNIITDRGITNAQKVIALLRKMPAIKNVSEMYVGTFKNGREDGYRINVYFKNAMKYHSVYVTESRGGDSILVVYDQRNMFDDIYSDEAYGNAQYFPYGKFDQAAKYIYKAIKGHASLK